MGSREYRIPLQSKPFGRDYLVVRVYADRSVEMGMHFLDGEFHPRPDHLQTRQQAADVLRFARFIYSDSKIERVRL